ncbi:MAG TPA: hypothetical protein VGL69_01065 [Solirubrobacteraceae bacterium]
MKLPGMMGPPELPTAGARIPGVTVRAAFVLAGVLLTAADYGLRGWLGVGIVLSVAAAWFPRYLLGWVLILFLAVGQLARHPGLSWQLLVLLAGVHLLHVLAMLMLELPWRSWLAPALFVAPLRRFVVIQVTTQLLAVLALLLLAPSHDGHRPLSIGGLAVVGSAALTGLGMLLFGPRADEDREG